MNQSEQPRAESPVRAAGIRRPLRGPARDRWGPQEHWEFRAGGAPAGQGPGAASWGSGASGRSVLPAQLPAADPP